MYMYIYIYVYLHGVCVCVFVCMCVSVCVRGGGGGGWEMCKYMYMYRGMEHTHVCGCASHPFNIHLCMRVRVSAWFCVSCLQISTCRCARQFRGHFCPSRSYRVRGEMSYEPWSKLLFRTPTLDKPCGPRVLRPVTRTLTTAHVAADQCATSSLTFWLLALQLQWLDIHHLSNDQRNTRPQYHILRYKPTCGVLRPLKD